MRVRPPTHARAAVGRSEQTSCETARFQNQYLRPGVGLPGAIAPFIAHICPALVTVRRPNAAVDGPRRAAQIGPRACAHNSVSVAGALERITAPCSEREQNR